VLRFPPGFLWGSATSAYQIEGAAATDGRGASVWDTFSHTPGRVAHGDTGDVAADHYHRYRDDVALMAELGLGAYRFSVSWPRVQPEGIGPANEAGLDFYERLVDELVAHGIVPVLTLFHWDLPQALQDRGGWHDRDTAARFAEYAALVHARIGDRVPIWNTINEPRTHAFIGHSLGEHAPGLRDVGRACSAVHHQLLGHGLAAQAMRALDGTRATTQIGAAIDPAPVSSRGTRPIDAETVRRIDGILNRLYLDPLLRGHYPDDVRADLPELDRLIRDGDEAMIAQPLDFLGVNYYRRYLIVAEDAPVEEPPGEFPGAENARFLPAGEEVTDIGWGIDPSGLCDLLVGIARDYPAVPPIYITENGAAFDDHVIDVGGEPTVDDPRRIAYLDGHVRALHEAIARGVDVRGYFLWSLLDNFEWAHGYGMRFGIVHVDFDTLERTPKASARWYSEVARSNALALQPSPG
jgi:beta-glucosidase